MGKSLVIADSRYIIIGMLKLPEFVSNNTMGVLCTSDDHCNPSGATVFFMLENDKLYCLTHGDSTKAKHAQTNKHACFVVVDYTQFEQAQIYGDVCVVDKPADFVSKLQQNIETASEQANTMPPYTLIKGSSPVVIQLTPTLVKHFRPGIGMTIIKDK